MAIPRELGVIHTPLVVAEWASALRTHPDRAFTRYIIAGLTYGFRIGFNRQAPLSSAASNMHSANLHPEVISVYLQKETSLGRMLGPFPPSFTVPELHINRFGVIPKGHNTVKWRLITDLSFPPGRSVNDGVAAELCSLTYTTVDQVAEVVVSLGKAAMMAKIDIESAYRLIPVHPHDRPLQAVQWLGQIYIDTMLPFGLRSAPKIFNAVADAFHWHLRQQGIRHILHYLDDFIIIAPPNSPQCKSDLSTLMHVAGTLGIPIASHKTEGPATSLTFLGIEVDTVAGELRLPRDKLQRLKDLLVQWGNRKVCTRKELESLIGLLNHACKVVRSGHSFLHRMIDLLHARSHAHHVSTQTLIRLNMGFRADLAWWQGFVEEWNGTSFLHTPRDLPSLHVASDASGHWGCGAWWGAAWLQMEWSATTSTLPIAVKELLPILIGSAIWGQAWSYHRVVWHCDNQAVVSCLRSRTSRHPILMHLLRNLVYIEALSGFYIAAEYIDTHANHIADDLSRNRVSSFLLKVPQASPTPTSVPAPLVDLLLDHQADWTCQQWQLQFRHILTRVWPNQHKSHTRQQ